MTYALIQLQVMTGHKLQSDIEFELMGISNSRQILSSNMASLIATGVDTGDAQIVQIEALDQALELQKDRLETQYKSISNDVESWEKVLSSNVKKDNKVDING